MPVVVVFEDSGGAVAPGCGNCARGRTECSRHILPPELHASSPAPNVDSECIPLGAANDQFGCAAAYQLAHVLLLLPVFGVAQPGHC